MRFNAFIKIYRLKWLQNIKIYRLKKALTFIYLVSLNAKEFFANDSCVHGCVCLMQIFFLLWFFSRYIYLFTYFLFRRVGGPHPVFLRSYSWLCTHSWWYSRDYMSCLASEIKPRLIAWTLPLPLFKYVYLNFNIFNSQFTYQWFTTLNSKLYIFIFV